MAVEAVREAGRLPTFSLAISSVGVIERKNVTNRSSPYTSRRYAVERQVGEFAHRHFVGRVGQGHPLRGVQQ